MVMQYSSQAAITSFITVGAAGLKDIFHPAFGGRWIKSREGEEGVGAKSNIGETVQPHRVALRSSIDLEFRQIHFSNSFSPHPLSRAVGIDQWRYRGQGV